MPRVSVRPDPKRVIHVLPHAGGGAETYIDMLTRLPGFEHQRFFLSTGRTPRSGLVSIPRRWPRLAVEQRGADLIHCHGDVASAIALPLLRQRPAVMTCQGLHMLRRLHGSRRTVMDRTIEAVVASCRAVICSSSDERDELARLVRDRDREKLRVIYNGIDSPPQIDQQERMSLRAELGVTSDAVLALFVGQLEPRKAPLLAARAATRARAAGAPLVLAVAGDGPEAPRLRALGADAVKLLGYRSDVGRLLAAADVFLQPSEREGMSFALLEAMSHGLAVVASDSSSNPEAIGDTGLLHPAGDEAALAQALMRLSSDPALRDALAAAARRRALERFSPEGFLAASEAVYSQSLGGARAPGRSFAGSPA